MAMTAGHGFVGAGTFGLGPMALAIQGLYRMVVSVNDFIDDHIETLKRSPNPTHSHGRQARASPQARGDGAPESFDAAARKHDRRMTARSHDTQVRRLAMMLVKLNQGESLDPQALAEEFGVHLRTIQRDLNERVSYLPLQYAEGKYQLEPAFLGKFVSLRQERRDEVL